MRLPGCVCLLLIMVAGLAEARPVDVTTAPVVALAGSLQHLEDPGAELTPEAVHDAWRKGHFLQLRGDLSAGYTDAAIWLTFQLANPSEVAQTRVLSVPPAHLDQITLYWYEAGSWQAVTLGDDQPWTDRALRDRVSSFPVSLPPDGGQRYFLRIESEGNVAAAPTVATPEARFWSAQLGMFLYGGLMLAGLVVALSNVLQWWLVRQRVFLFYAMFVAVSTAYLLLVEGVLHVLLNPAAPIAAAPWVTVLHGALMLTSHLFMREVTGLRRLAPLVDGILWVLTLGAALAAVTSAAAGWDLYVKPWMWMAFLVQVVLALGASGWLAVLGHRGALHYLLAFAATAIGLVVSATAVIGWHDQAIEHNFGNALTALVHLVLMQLVASASARRAQLTRTEAEAIELDAIRRTQAQLEQEVGARTAALHETNASLQEEVARGQLLATRLEHARARLEQALAEQRELTAEQKNFMRMVAHEFRTPMAVISASSEMIEETSAELLDQLALRSLKRQQRAVSRLKDLIERALAFEELNDSGWTLRRERLDLAELIDDVVAQSRLEPTSGVTLEVDLERVVLEGDGQLLEVLFGNLLDNAIKHSPEAGHVRVSSAMEDGWLRVNVDDQGRGVPEAERERLFQKFTRGSDTNVPGFGVGLYMVRRIAQSHGGRVALLDSPSGGARVSVWLPLVPPASPNVDGGQDQAEGLAGAGDPFRE